MTELLKSYTAVHGVSQKVHLHPSKSLKNKKFCDLSAQEISRASGIGSVDGGAGNCGPGECSNGENECSFKVSQSSMLHMK